MKDKLAVSAIALVSMAAAMLLGLNRTCVGMELLATPPQFGSDVDPRSTFASIGTPDFSVGAYWEAFSLAGTGIRTTGTTTTITRGDRPMRITRPDGGFYLQFLGR